jgi:MFS family permease
MSADKEQIDRAQRRFGPVWLSPGITPLNLGAIFWTAGTYVGFITAVNLVQPYLLQEHLGLTEGTGEFTGRLTVYAEIVMLIFTIPIGALSDRVGRRPVLATGILIILLGLAALPMARTPDMLIAARLVIALGVATVAPMIYGLLYEYPQDASRGKLLAINGVCASLGVLLIAFGIAALPNFFQGRGYSPIEAGTYTFWVTAGLAAITFMVVVAGTAKGRRSQHAEPLPTGAALIGGLREVATNPRLGLACAANFVSRGDLTVLAAFFSLWIVRVGVAQGIDTAEAAQYAGQLFGVSQLVMLVSVPVFGYLIDRLDRVTIVALVMAIAMLGYLALGMVGDPWTSAWIYPVVALVGVGEGGLILAGQALAGQEAPAPVRGAVAGIVVFIGALGTLGTNYLSGLLFDGWMFQGPFILMGVLNGVVCVWALFVRR